MTTLPCQHNMPALTFVLAAMCVSVCAAAASPRVLPGVDLSENAGPQSIMLVVKGEMGLDEMAPLDDTLPRSLKREAVYSFLTDRAERGQKCARAALRKRNVEFQAFWITNAISVREVAGPVLRDIITECGYEIEEVRQMGYLKRRIPPQDSMRPQPVSSKLQWNIEKVGADKAWADGHDGTGVVVATLDGGVRYTHDALINNYRGTVDADKGKFEHDYNWKDWPYKNKEPLDSDGHGTNVQGILSGSKESGVGVAPGAKWISGKIFNYAGYSSNEWTLSGVQWAMCPTPLASRYEQSGNCSLGADVVSCSWGEDDATTGFLKDAMAAWLKAGMVPVFAVGNAGPHCGTVVSPADYAGVLSVGATDKHDEMVEFSSRGPGANGTKGALPYDPLTPNLVAPGLMIQGPSHKSDDGYTGFSGTSQAAPHVAGAAALLLSAHPSWSPHQVAEALYATAATASLPVPDSGWDKCGMPDAALAPNASATFPNFIAGYGRLDAASAAAYSKAH